MTDTELQGRVNKALDNIDARIRNWEEIKFDLDRKLDDEWDYEDEIEEASCEAALDQLTSVKKILIGEE